MHVMSHIYLAFCFASFFLSINALSASGLSLGNAQCPCIQLPDGRCYQYDTRFMASDLEEALVSFPDLSLLDPPDPVDIKPQQGDQTYCSTEECLICQSDIRQRVTEVGLASFTAVNSTSNITCTRYGFTRQKSGYTEAKGKMCKEESSSESDECDCSKYPQSQHKRGPRQAAPALLGARYGIACTQKGVMNTATGEAVSLCSSCWAWRMLPENYFPRFLNELICDDTDNICLSGYASCAVGNRNMDVLRNDSGILTTVSLTSGTYCECKVMPSSALFGLVNGTGVATSLPPI